MISRNLLLAGRRDVSQRARLWTARFAVVVPGLIAWLMARGSDGVMTSIENASGFGSAGVLVCVVLALFTRRGASFGAGCALIAGASAWVIARYGQHLGIEVKHPYLISLLAAILGLTIGSAAHALVRLGGVR